MTARLGPLLDAVGRHATEIRIVVGDAGCQVNVSLDRVQLLEVRGVASWQALLYESEDHKPAGLLEIALIDAVRQLAERGVKIDRLAAPEADLQAAIGKLVEVGVESELIVVGAGGVLPFADHAPPLVNAIIGVVEALSKVRSP